MSETSKRMLYWTPRILCIAFAAFLAIFALDVFELPIGPWQMILAFVIHLIPTSLVLIVLAIVWSQEWIAAVVFPLLAIFHVATKWGQLDWSAYAAIDGPLLLLAVLFLFSWRNRAR